MDEQIREVITIGGCLFRVIKNNFLGKKEISKEMRSQVFKRVVAPYTGQRH